MGLEEGATIPDKSKSKQNKLKIIVIIFLFILASIIITNILFQEKYKEKILNQEIYIDSSGNAHIIWQTRNHYYRNEERIYYSKVDKDGSVITKQMEILDSSLGYGPDMDTAIDKNENIHIVYINKDGISYVKIDLEGNKLIPETLIFSIKEQNVKWYFLPRIIIDNDSIFIISISQNDLKKIQGHYQQFDLFGNQLGSNITFYDFLYNSGSRIQDLEITLDNNQNLNLFWKNTKNSRLEHLIIDIENNSSAIYNNTYGMDIADFNMIGNGSLIYISLLEIVGYSKEPLYQASIYASASVPQYYPIYNQEYIEFSSSNNTIINQSTLHNNTELQDPIEISCLYFFKNCSGQLFAAWEQNRILFYSEWKGISDYNNGTEISIGENILSNLRESNSNLFSLKIVDNEIILKSYDLINNKQKINTQVSLTKVYDYPYGRGT
jgi:hypothetical protein